MKGKEKNMIEIRNIIQRLKTGQSIRQICRDLSVHRTIIRQLHNLAISHGWLDPDRPMPSNEELDQLWNIKKQIASAHPLDPYKELIAQWHQEDYSSVVILRLLRDRCECNIQMVRRYRKKHFPSHVKPVMVRTTVPGRDLELDFGELGRFFNEKGELKKVWLFSLRLRHSRKAYREITVDQKLNTFLMGHVRAFEYFNGVPSMCILDNLKSGVTKSTVDNDMTNRSYQGLAEHYGFIISPCLPRTPEHKGGVEGDVKYVKRNFLPYFLEKQKEMGIPISTISCLDEALKKWAVEIDDAHIIQGVGRSPDAIFNSEEQGALKSLPRQRWEPTQWFQCHVRRDWRIMYDSAYYSVPYHLIGKKVDVCATDTIVRIFYESREVALHEKAKNKWEYKRKTEHAPPAQEAVLNCSREGLLLTAGKIGPFTQKLATEILSHPTVDKLRPVRHLLRLVIKYSEERLENACQRAFNNKLFSYNSVKNILENRLDLESVGAQEVEKVINLNTYRFHRDLNDYKSQEFPKRESFDEAVARLHPYSKHGNAMMKPSDSSMADQTIEEELQEKRLKKELSIEGRIRCQTEHNFTGVS